MQGNPRRTVTIVVAVVVILGLVAAIAYLAGRSHTATPPQTEQSPAAGPTTRAPQPSAPVSSDEPGLEAGEAKAGEGGDGTGPAGLPLGYSRDEAGAVAAATNYLMWLNSIRIADQGVADDLAAAAAADEATETLLVQSFGQTRSGLEGLRDDQLEPARGAYAVADFDDEHATVYVWAPEVTTDVNGTVDHLWAIDAVNVAWVKGDWKLDGDLIARTGGAAVDPADPAGNPSAAEKLSILTRDPADPGEITDSAEQTWFEYGNAMR